MYENATGFGFGLSLNFSCSAIRIKFDNNEYTPGDFKATFLVPRKGCSRELFDLARGLMFFDVQPMAGSVRE